MGKFVSDVAEIRRRAREHIEKGPVTGGYKADLPRVVEVLNEALATEIVCVLRYKRHSTPPPAACWSRSSRPRRSTRTISVRF